MSRLFLLLTIVIVMLVAYDIIFNLSPELDRNMRIEIGVKPLPHSPGGDVKEIFPDFSR